MTSRMKQNGTLVKSTVIGIALSVAVTLLLSAVIAWMIEKESLDIGTMKHGSFIIQFLASLVGCAVAARGERGWINGLIAGIGYLVVLMCMNALFFDGIYEGILLGLLAVSLGCAGGILVNNLPKRRKVRRRRKR